MFSINKNFRFNNRNEAISLTDSSVTSKTPSIFLDSLVSRASVSRDFKYCSPFGKTASKSIIFLGHGIKSIKSHSCGFVISSRKNLKSLVNLDTWEDSLGGKELYEVGSTRWCLFSSFRVEDNTRNVLVKSFSGEEEFTICTSVIDCVFNSNSTEFLANCTSRFISSEDTSSWGSELCCSLSEFFSEVSHLKNLLIICKFCVFIKFLIRDRLIYF